jgi:hypothetical protein
MPFFPLFAPKTPVFDWGSWELDTHYKQSERER